MTYNLKQLWEKACEYDNIPIPTSFAVFSKDNPWAKKYNTLAYLIARYREQN